MIDINELRKLAQAATPGPWGNTDPDPTIINSPYNQLAICYRNSRALADAKFIAAANPAAISELLDRLEAAERERDRYKLAYNDWIAKTEWLQHEIACNSLSAKYLGMHRADAIKTEIDRLRAGLDNIKQVEFERRVESVANGWRDKCARLARERDALRAKVAEMEQQAPIATLHDDGYFTLEGSRPYESDFAGWRMKVYALPGAKGEEK